MDGAVINALAVVYPPHQLQVPLMFKERFLTGEGYSVCNQEFMPAADETRFGVSWFASGGV